MRFGLLMAALLTLSCATGANEMNDHSRAMQVDELMRTYQGAVPGAAVLVLRNGEVSVSKGYGMADLEASLPVTPETNFRLASVSKQFTATAIGILEERKLLAYDDPITRHLPAFPSYADGITIRHLLTHSSGLMDYEDLIPEGTTEQVHDRDVLRLLSATDRTLFEPGGSYRYSNTGYALLALIVETVSGESYTSFLEGNVFAPSSMRGSVAHVEGVTRVPNRAYGYVSEDGAWVQRDQSVTSAVLGDGGVYSNIADLARWDESLTHAGVVSAETLRLATTPAIETDVPRESYGFGWRVREHHGRRMIWHSGETSGFRNVLLRFPDDRLTVIILTNRSDPKPYDTAMNISELYLD